MGKTRVDTLDIRDGQVQTQDISGSAVTPDKAALSASWAFEGGLSGSLTQLADGSSYIIAGSGINVLSESNGAVTIDSTINEDIERQEIVASQNVTGTDTALSDTLNNTPKSNASVKLYLNGLLQAQGAGFDYTISGTTITWLAGTGTASDLTTSDTLIAVYVSN